MKKGRTVHLSVDIKGFLRIYKGKDMSGLMTDDDDNSLSDAEIRKELNDRLELGHTLICASSECEGFDPFGGGCPGHEFDTLVVNVKREYFEAMKAGIKTEEYRLKTPYWYKRLEGKHFDYVEVCLGYPKADDHERRLTFECKGIKTALVSHPIWANEPKFVYAIQLGDRR